MYFIWLHANQSILIYVVHGCVIDLQCMPVDRRPLIYHQLIIFMPGHIFANRWAIRWEWRAVDTADCEILGDTFGAVHC